MCFYDKSGFVVYNENEQLNSDSLFLTVLLYFLSLCYNPDQTMSIKLENRLETFLNEHETMAGIFYEHPRWWRIYVLNYKDFIRQIISLISFLYYFNDKAKIHNTWEQIKKQGFHYDNSNPYCPSETRKLKLYDILYLGYLAENWLCILFFWIFGIMSLIYSFKDTKEILLFFVKSQCCYGKQMLILRKIYDMILTIRFGEKAWCKVFHSYFNSIKHPCVQLSKEIV